MREAFVVVSLYSCHWISSSCLTGAVVIVAVDADEAGATAAGAVGGVGVEVDA